MNVVHVSHHLQIYRSESVKAYFKSIQWVVVSGDNKSFSGIASKSVGKTSFTANEMCTLIFKEVNF